MNCTHFGASVAACCTAPARVLLVGSPRLAVGRTGAIPCAARTKPAYPKAEQYDSGGDGPEEAIERLVPAASHRQNVSAATARGRRFQHRPCREQEPPFRRIDVTRGAGDLLKGMAATPKDAAHLGSVPSRSAKTWPMGVTCDRRMTSPDIRICAP